jgi:hypothetical protein
VPLEINSNTILSRICDIFYNHYSKKSYYRGAWLMISIRPMFFRVLKRGDLIRCKKQRTQ